MGFTPQQINTMSVWQYMVCVQGYIEANSSDEAQGMAQAEYDAVAADVLAVS